MSERRPALSRVLGLWDATWLVAGSIFGAGIFITPGIVAGLVPGRAGPLAVWLAGGVLALAGAAVYAELGARIPRAGGDYQYLRAAFGPLWGFLSGWAAFLVTFSGAAAVMCLVATDNVAAALGVSAAEGPRRALAAAGLALGLTATNAAGARIAGRTTALLTIVPIAGLTAIFGLGLALGDGAPRPQPPPVAPPGLALGALAAAFVPVFFAYSGWNAAAYLVEELRDPRRHLARALLGGTLLVTVVYVLFNLVLLVVLPAERLAGSTTAAAEAARLLAGPTAERALALVIAMAVTGTANATLMIGARMYLAMARDGLAPRFMARTSRAGVPAPALWASGAWGALLCLAADVGQLVSWATLAILLLSSLTVAALFVLRARRVGEPAFGCPGYPLTPLVYIAVSLAVAVASVRADRAQALAALALALTAWPAYAILRRTSRVAR